MVSKLKDCQVAVLSEEHKSGIKQRLKDPSALDGIDDVILIELERKPLLSKLVTVKFDPIDPPTYDKNRRKLSMKVIVTNQRDSAVRLHEYFADSLRFLIKDAIDNSPGYPEDLMARGALSLDDESSFEPGETREVDLEVTITKWGVQQPIFAGLLIFYDEQDNPEVVEINPAIS